MSKITANVEICLDCIQYYAGVSAQERGETYSSEFPPLITFGTDIDGNVYSYNLNLPLGRERFFSSVPCDGCGNPEPGDRWDAKVTIFKGGVK